MKAALKLRIESYVQLCVICIKVIGQLMIFYDVG